MPREVNGEDGINWSCVEAYAGLSDEGGEAAARAATGDDDLTVVCTPGGGAKSVRLRLPRDSEAAFDDERRLREIESHRET